MTNEQISNIASSTLNNMHHLDDNNKVAVIIDSLQILLQKITRHKFNRIKFHSDIHKQLKEMIKENDNT